MIAATILQSGAGGHSPFPAPRLTDQPLIRDGVALTFLIIEDQFVIAMDIESIIEGAGGHVLGMAAAAAEAERMAETLRPDVVLMDVRLRDDRDGMRRLMSSRRGPGPRLCS